MNLNSKVRESSCLNGRDGGFLALYGFDGRSSVNGYDGGAALRAGFSDRTLGFGVAIRVIQRGNSRLAPSRRLHIMAVV